MKTYRVLMAETHSQYYEVKAKNEDQAIERAYAYDEGGNDQVHADTEVV